MSRLFDAYIIVDWSAAAKPATGANSIWVGILARDARLKFQYTSVNPRTRLEARQFIGDMAEKLIARGDKVLIGFDFALGYPSGTAEALGLDLSNQAPWQAMHAHLASKVKEKPDNSNARFALAAGMNYAISKGPHPFWGTTKRDDVSTLSMKKGDFASGSYLAEHRMCEEWVRGGFGVAPKSVWQLMGAGSVGSQALLGIPTVFALRERVKNSRIWPFELGMGGVQAEDLDGINCVFAEVYPSTIKTHPKAGEVLDQAQVESLARHFLTLDEAGKLGPAFAAPDSLETGKIHKIVSEEGWILAK